MSEPSNTDDVIDSRDVIARIRELEDEREAIDSDTGTALEIIDRFAQWDADNGPELAALKSLEDQAEGYCDWAHGATLIRDSYFKEYARQYAEDVCELPNSWPLSCIDWDQAATELRMDFTGVDFDGVTYWVQS